MAYIRATWQMDDVITADKLNNIEEGIKEVEDNGLTIGTTASTAKAGNYQPTWSQVTGKPTSFAPSAHSHAWSEVTDKPATFPPTIGTTASTAKAGNYQPTAANISDASAIGRTVLTSADAGAVRSAIGAGTSSLELGTSASQAAAGNHTHNNYATVTALNALTARVEALENLQD